MCRRLSSDLIPIAGNKLELELLLACPAAAAA